jgi:hypothetical protein
MNIIFYFIPHVKFFHQQHFFLSFFPLVHVCLTSPLPLATPKEPTSKRLAKSVTETHLDLTIYNSCEGLLFQIPRQVKITGLGRQISRYIHEGRTILSGGLKNWNGSSQAHSGASRHVVGTQQETIDMHTVQIMTACVGN